MKGGRIAGGGVYPELAMSRRRERDAVDGVGWLLGLRRSVE